MLGDEAHFLCAKAFQPMRVQVVAGRRADKRRCVGEAVLHEAWRRLPEKGARHPQEVEGVVVAEKVGEGGLWDGVIAHGWRHSDAWSEGCAGGVGLQVYANAMGVLGMLQQEPGTGEGLLTCGAYITGRLIPATCNTQRKKCLNILTMKLKNLLFFFFILHSWIFSQRWTGISDIKNISSTKRHTCKVLITMYVSVFDCVCTQGGSLKKYGNPSKQRVCSVCQEIPNTYW